MNIRETDIKNDTQSAKQVESQKSISADVDKLILAGILEREVVPFKAIDFKVTMHTLTDDERIAAMEMLPNLDVTKPIIMQEYSKVPTLAYAITEITTKTKTTKIATENDRKSLISFLKTRPAYVIDALYLAYLKLMGDMIELFETGVKKN